MPKPPKKPPNWPDNKPWPPGGSGDGTPTQNSVPTPPAIELTNEWKDVYGAAGIPVGTQILINTRGKHSAFLAESVADPGDHPGIELYPTRQAIVDEGSIGLWAKSAHNSPFTLIIVQVDEV